MALVFLFCFVFPISPFKCLANICIALLTGKSLKTTSAHANKPRIHFTGRKKKNQKPKKTQPKACLFPTAIPTVALYPLAPVAAPGPAVAGRGTRPPACTLAAVGCCFCKHRHRCPHPTNTKPSLPGGGSAGTLRAALRAAPPRHCWRTPGSRAPAEAARSGRSAR